MNSEVLNQTGRYEETTSNRFNNIKTSLIMDNFKTLGWEPRAMASTRSRIAERRPYAKHLVSLGKVGEELVRGEVFPRINIRNANDGTASLELFAGFYRAVCANGLMVGTHYHAVKVRHSLSVDKLGNALAEAVELTEQEIERSGRTIEEWKTIRLTTNQQENLAGFAVSLRWGSFFKNDGRDKVAQAVGFPSGESFHPAETNNRINQFMREEFENRTRLINSVRRSEDDDASLWATFNRIQENIIQGGHRVYQPRNTSRGMEIRTRLMRGIKAVGEVIKINRQLWDGAETIARGEALPLALVS